MKEIWNNYSGIIAIIGYLLLLFIFLKLKKRKKPEQVTEKAEPLDLNDEYKTVAALVAAIECRNEEHRNVRVISVKEVG
ncbi:MAG: hypothetical protein J5365_03990 [Erysipelotrichaceae bacterium]|nr:hypothetical protein [Erysipelotrichaceae bacterium]